MKSYSFFNLSSKSLKHWSVASMVWLAGVLFSVSAFSACWNVHIRPTVFLPISVTYTDCSGATHKKESHGYESIDFDVQVPSTSGPKISIQYFDEQTRQPKGGPQQIELLRGSSHGKPGVDIACYAKTLTCECSDKGACK